MLTHSEGQSGGCGAEVKDSLRALLAGTARGHVRLPLISGSMAPAIMPGDTLVVRPVDGRRVHTGDVVVFVKDSRVTAHRVIFVFRLGRRAWMLEMGDANRKAGWLMQDAVLGVVDSVERDSRPVLQRRGLTKNSSREIAHALLRRFMVESMPFERLRRIFRA